MDCKNHVWDHLLIHDWNDHNLLYVDQLGAVLRIFFTKSKYPIFTQKNYSSIHNQVGPQGWLLHINVTSNNKGVTVLYPF